MINNNKLKVMLCEEDLRQFELKAEQLDYSNTETKRMFWDVLSQAKRKTGFDTDGQRVLVHLYPSKEGGCEMFVTKVGVFPVDEEKCKSKTSEKVCFTQVNKKITKKTLSFTVFRFDEISSMIEVCKKLTHIGYIGESSAYASANGDCYLFLSELDYSEFSIPNEFSFICEYGSYEESKMIKYYLLEHGKSICNSNAVANLSNL